MGHLRDDPQCLNLANQRNLAIEDKLRNREVSVERTCVVTTLVCGKSLSEISTPRHPPTSKKHGKGHSDGCDQASHRGSVTENVRDGESEGGGQTGRVAICPHVGQAFRFRRLGEVRSCPWCSSYLRSSRIVLQGQNTDHPNPPLEASAPSGLTSIQDEPDPPL
jgi:hypothetical protein